MCLVRRLEVSQGSAKTAFHYLWWLVTCNDMKFSIWIKCPKEWIHVMNNLLISSSKPWLPVCAENLLPYHHWSFHSNCNVTRNFALPLLIPDPGVSLSSRLKQQRHLSHGPCFNRSFIFSKSQYVSLFQKAWDRNAETEATSFIHHCYTASRPVGTPRNATK